MPVASLGSSVLRWLDRQEVERGQQSKARGRFGFAVQEAEPARWSRLSRSLHAPLPTASTPQPFPEVPVIKVRRAGSGLALSVLVDEEEASGCGGPGRWLTRSGAKYKVRSTSPSSWRFVLGVWETEEEEKCMQSLVRCGPCSLVTDQIRRVKFQETLGGIRVGRMSVRKVRMEP